MSILKVDTINEKTSGNGVRIPGHVVQCQQFYNSQVSHVTTTSTSFVASGIAKSITPKYSDSLIIIQSNISMSYATDWMSVRMYLNSSPMPSTGDYQVGYLDDTYNQYTGLTFAGQHQATSTSALNFEIYYRSASSSTMAYITHNNGSSALTLWEIAQ